MKMLKLWGRPPWLLAALVLLCSSYANAFHSHKIIAAALLANSLQRNRFLPLPIPIPIPIKAGGNTIIALANEPKHQPAYVPIHINNCHPHPPPCYKNYGRRDDFW